MSNRIEKDITLEDIDNLFNNNDTSVLKTPQDIVPKEFSVENDFKTNHVDRPKDKSSEKTKIKKEIKENNQKIVDNINDKILDVKELTSLSQVKIYLRKLNELKNIEQIKSHNTKAIINGLTKTNVDKGTDCTFHLYNVRDVLGNKIYCYCRYCSCEKIFTKDEWDDYCIKYRKWF